MKVRRIDITTEGRAFNPGRRYALKSLAALPICAIFQPTWAAPASPVIVDTSGVTDIPSLLLVIKKTGRSVLQSVADKDIIQAIADSFVRHAEELSEVFGTQIPEEIRRLLPSASGKKWRTEAVAAGILVTVLGIAFLLPKVILGSVVVASMGVRAPILSRPSLT